MTPKAEASASGTGRAATVTSACALQVEVDHLADIHAVDVVGAEHRHQVRYVLLDQIEVLDTPRPTVPWNQSGPPRIWGGTTVTNCSWKIGESTQDRRMCSIRDCDLYCTSR